MHPADAFDIAELSGIVPPLVTPLSDGELDTVGLERLVEFVLCADVQGLFVLGTTGEGPALSQRTRRDVIAETVSVAANRLPVLVGISDSAMSDALAMARWAHQCGADAVVATPPFYFPQSQNEVAQWFETLAGESPLPVLLYNFPTLAKTAIDPATAKRLTQCENIAGIKDSAGDMEVFAEFCRLSKQRPDWRVFIGPEQLLAEGVMLGAHGGVAGGANIRPQLFVDFYHAAVAGDQAKVAELREQVDAMHQQVYGPISCQSVIGGLKRELARKGVCGSETTWELKLGQAVAEPRD